MHTCGLGRGLPVGSAADATLGNDAITGSDAGGSSDGDGTGAVGQDANAGAGATDAQDVGLQLTQPHHVLDVTSNLISTD